MISITGILKNPQGVVIQNAQILFEQARNSTELLAGTDFSLLTSATGAYSTTIGTGTFTIKVRFQNETQFRTLASNVIVVSSMNGYSLNQILAEQSQLEDVDYDLLQQVIQARDAQAASATQAATSQTNAAQSEASALQSKNAAQTSQTNAAQSATQANTSKNQAATSQTNAANSATAAQASQSTASTKASEASQSAQQASSSASTASTKASEASQSAQQAQTSRDAAQVSETNSAASAAQALVSQNQAKTSETNAKTSETSALQSKNAAQTSQTNAASSASQALASKNQAQTSETNAQSSQSQASTSATAAQGSASAAATDAASAQASATTATTQATNAAQSATQANTSKNQAATSATTASTKAGEASTSQTNAASSATTASTKAGEASTSQTNAAQSATTATTKAGEASSSQTNAAQSATLAQKWAANPENTVVSGGLYSALHYAAKAAQAAQTANGQLIWRGGWSAQAGNAPPTPSGTTADFYRITQAGTILGVPYDIGDYIHWDNINSIWFKMDGTDSVTSVNGLSGQVTLDYNSVGAAPAGFGLGGVGKSLSNLSCDTATESGFYQVYSGTTETPFGSGPSGSTLVVSKWGDAGVMQTFYSYTSDRVFVRRKYASVWQPWFELYSTAKKPTAQEIGALQLTGGTLTGTVTLQNTAPQFWFQETDNADQKWGFIADGGGFRLNKDNSSTSDQTLVFRVFPTGELELNNPVSRTQQKTTANALTRYDYVNSQIAQTGAGTGVGTNPNATTITGGVRDFDLAKTNGTYTVEGLWINGVTNIGATGVTHSGVLEVSQRSIDSFTQQKFKYTTTQAGVTIPREFTRVWGNSTEGWSPWIASGIYETSSTYRMGILRLNNQQSDDSTYPYFAFAKEKYRDSIQQDLQYTIGDISFRANTPNRYDPHSGDQMSRILGQVFNTTTTGQYEGGLFLAARYRSQDGNTQDTSTIAVNRYVGAEFTHAGKKVKLNTGNVTAENFYQNTQQDTQVNALTRVDWVNSRLVGTIVSEILLTNTDNLDTIKTPGVYRNTQNAVASTQGLNYPVPLAGTLVVLEGAGVTQRYYVYNSSSVYSRAQYSQGAWTPWIRDYNEQFKPTAQDTGALAITGGTLTGTVNGTRFTASDQYAFVSSISQYHGIFLGTGTDKRAIIGGGDVTSGAVHIRPRGMTTITNETVFNNDGTITGGSTPTLSQHLVNKGYVDQQDQLKLSLTGGILTGGISITSSHPQSGATQQIFHNGGAQQAGTPNMIRSMREHSSATWLWEKVYNGRIGYSSGNDGAAQDKIVLNIGVGDINITGGLTTTTAGNAVSTIGGKIISQTADIMTVQGSKFAFVSSAQDAHLCYNQYYDGAWKKFSNATNSMFNSVNSAGFRVYGSAANQTDPRQTLLMSVDYAGLMTLQGQLNQVGNITTGGSIYVSGGYQQIQSNGTNSLLEFHIPGVQAAMIYLTSSGQLRFTSSNGSAGETQLRMAISTQGVVSASDYVVLSDKSIKTDLQQIDSPLEKVCRLTGYTYVKKGKEGREAGLLAQDVQKEQPESVGEVDGLLAISNSGVNALLVEAIKQLKQEVDQLRRQINGS